MNLTSKELVRLCMATPINLPSAYVVAQRSVSPHRDTRFGRKGRDAGVVLRERLWHDLRHGRQRVHDNLHPSLGHI